MTDDEKKEARANGIVMIADDPFRPSLEKSPVLRERIFQWWHELKGRNKQ